MLIEIYYKLDYSSRDQMQHVKAGMHSVYYITMCYYSMEQWNSLRIKSCCYDYQSNFDTVDYHNIL